MIKGLIEEFKLETYCKELEKCNHSAKEYCQKSCRAYRMYHAMKAAGVTCYKIDPGKKATTLKKLRASRKRKNE
jgi:hypothetical protein